MKSPKAKEIVDMIKAKADMEHCQQSRCTKDFIEVQKKKVKVDAFARSMMIKMLTGKITPEEFKTKVQEFTHKLMNSAQGQKLLACSFKECRKEAEASLKLVSKQVNVKYDAQDMKDLESYIKITMKIVDKIFDQIEIPKK